ncbi:MAG: hypothetical protein FWG35_03415, partial [Spirochaetaceae bacterium]|nr:hypothetical protein [Spirochaetaceae bacterium]
MAEAKNTTEKKEAFLNALSSFIQRRRKIILALVLIVVAALVGLVIALQIRKGRQEASFVQIEEVQKKFAEWLQLEEEAEREGAAEEIRSRTDSLAEEVLRGAGAVAAEYGDLHAGARASDISASVFYRKKDYGKAAE